MEEFRILLGAELKSGELDKIKSSINNIQISPIKLVMDTKKVQSQLNSIKSQIQSLSNIKITLSSNSSGASNGVQRTVGEVTQAYNDLMNLQRRINSIRLQIGGLDSTKNSSQITALSGQLNRLMTDYNNLYQTFNKSFSTNQLDNLNRAFETTNGKISVLNAKVADTKAKLASGIAIKFVSNDISKVDADLSKIRTKSSEVVKGMQELNAAFSAMQTANSQGDINKLISAYERYQIALKNVKNQIEINKRAEKQSSDATKLVAAKQALSTQMDVWLRNNSAAAKQFGGQIQSLKAQLQSCDATQLNGIKAQFQEITRQASLAGKATMTFGDRFKAQMSKLGTYFSASMLITYGIRAMRDMYDNVVSVDTAMTGLYRVTDLTANEYDKLYDKMIMSAKEYGSTLSDLITSTADWVRLGFDANQAKRLSEITAMYQHVTDLDNSTAVENLVTAYKGFQDQLLELYDGDSAAAVEYVADIFDKLGNEYAVAASDVGAALTKCASALSLAGNSIQQTSGMATGIIEVTQDPEKSGSALKILSLRLRGMKGELEELGEEVDENVESISKMQTRVLNLTKDKVNIFEDDGSFKSTYEIMDGIAEVYNTLAETDQADLLETIAGKNRANDIGALIKNWENVEAATESAINAEGTAAAENEKYMKSLQGHIDAMTASWEALSNTFIKSDFLVGLIDTATKFLDILDGVIDKVGVLPTLIAGIAGYKAFRNVGELIKQFHYLITLGNEYAHKTFY